MNDYFGIRGFSVYLKYSELFYHFTPQIDEFKSRDKQIITFLWISLYL